MSCKAPIMDWLTGKVTNALWCSRQVTRQAKWMWAGLQWSHRWWKTAPPLLSEWRSLWGAVGSMKPNVLSWREVRWRSLSRRCRIFLYVLPRMDQTRWWLPATTINFFSHHHISQKIALSPRSAQSFTAAACLFKTWSGFHICSQIVPFSSVSIHPVSAQHIR